MGRTSYCTKNPSAIEAKAVLGKLYSEKKWPHRSNPFFTAVVDEADRALPIEVRDKARICALASRTTPRKPWQYRKSSTIARRSLKVAHCGPFVTCNEQF